MTKFETILIKFGKFVITFLIAVLDMDSPFDTYSENLLETSNTIQNEPTTIFWFGLISKGWCVKKRLLLSPLAVANPPYYG